MVEQSAYIKDVFVTYKLAGRYSLNGLRCRSCRTLSGVEITGAGTDSLLRQSIRKKDGGAFIALGEVATAPVETGACELAFSVGDVELWDIDSPVLYEMKTELLDGDGQVRDEVITTMGFRRAVFKKNGFYLNGRRIKICGQSSRPEDDTGSIRPDFMQSCDAAGLKYGLKCSAVRICRDPHSQALMEQCDQAGLLVFAAFPEGRVAGGDALERMAEDQLMENIKEMIVLCRNHPSVILWDAGTCESKGGTLFYERINKVVHMMDPSRQIGDIRGYKKPGREEAVFIYHDLPGEDFARGSWYRSCRYHTAGSGHRFMRR